MSVYIFTLMVGYVFGGVDSTQGLKKFHQNSYEIAEDLLSESIEKMEKLVF